MIHAILALIIGTTAFAAQPRNPFDPDLAWKQKTDIKESLDADFMVMIATMFPHSDLAQIKNASAIDRQNFVKRLYLLLLLNPPKFRPEKAELDQAQYDSQTQSVSYLMRGRRWMIDISGMLSEEFVKFLSGGKNIVNKRSAASHGASMTKNGQIVEVKLSGLKSGHALFYGLLGRHLGIDIPLGGYGNFSWNKSYRIGADGTPTDQNGKPIPSKIQHGHVYMYAQTFKKTDNPKSVLLIGIEQSAPGHKSMFNVVHDIASASKDSSLDPSLTNSNKWRYSGIAFQPADYNGMLSSVDIHAILQWENACKKFLTLSESIQQQFMEKWLRVPAQELVKRHKEIMKDIFDTSFQNIASPIKQERQWLRPKMPLPDDIKTRPIRQIPSA